MASQQQNIDGSSIEHSNVQQNQAGRDAVSFLNSYDNQVIIDNTFLKLFPQSDRSQVDWDWGLKLLEQKQLPEIRKRLTDTLGRDRILMDVSIEEQQKWVNRSPLAADRILKIDGKNCGTLNPDRLLVETFGRDDIKGKLLILGAPGAGKTTALLSLAEQLVCGAISQPKTVIPVIFELSTWRDDKQSIQDWLIEQLYDLHGGSRKSKLYEQWLERQVLLPLLDGLDELGLERQKKCTDKLNEFAERYPQMVVCCRVKEFEAVDIKLRNLRGAVCLQSLSDSQIQDYLDTLQRPELWEAIQTTPSLRAMLRPTLELDPGFLRMPLFVKLVANVYEPQQPISSKADLLDKYIDRQLSFDKRNEDRRKELDEYQWSYKTVKLEPDWRKTYNTLNWIARNLQTDNEVEFLIEHLQPAWIHSKSLQYFCCYYYCYCLITLLVFAMSICIINGLFSILFSMPLATGLFVVMGGRATSNLIEILLVIMLILVLIAFLISIGLMFGIFNWLVLEIIIKLIFGLIFGIVGGFILTNSNNDEDIQPVEFSMVLPSLFKQGNLKNSKALIANGFMIGLLSGLIIGMIGEIEVSLLEGITSGIIFGLIGGIIFASIEGLKQELKIQSSPNQGIWNSFQSWTWLTTIIFTLTTLTFLAFTGIQYWWKGLFFALVIGFYMGGGKAVLQHLSLRIILWQSGLPWNFARFLNYCVERRLLLRVGGSYRFLHRELLDHFAQSNH
jgi:NACHT domain